MDRWPAVYILASTFRGTIYIGVTSDLPARIWEHRSGIKSRFPAKYAVYRLVYVETFGDMDAAIAREKQLKRWHRPWKLNLIEADNPRWIDLAVDMGFARLPDRRSPRPEPSP
ncbi:MAG TPA: GIY-YIG nuclease family protein [Allosphingosinicella sp.]|nr:GIY-YIG nuclease family protein [Allosphingosinicella sp.]